MFIHRHGHIWTGLPGQRQEEQVLLCIEADEDPRRDPTKARAARPQREGGPDGGQPPFPHPPVSVGEGSRSTSYLSASLFHSDSPVKIRHADILMSSHLNALIRVGVKPFKY